MRLAFVVRENTRDIKGAPGYPDYKDCWVHISDVFDDYYEAIKYAVEYEKKGRYKCWVELLENYYE